MLLRKGSIVNVNSLTWYSTLSVLVAASAIDVRCQRVPNWLVFPFLLAGFGVSLSGFGAIAPLQSLYGFGLAVALTGVLCWLRGMGMGDLKLCAAIGAWIGPDQLVVAFVAMGMTGGLMAAVWAVWKRSLGACMDGLADLIVSWRTGLRPHPTLVLENEAKLKMPYVPAITVGTLFSFFGN
jgi:prepilin peptidase CpaA